MFLRASAFRYLHPFAAVLLMFALGTSASAAKPPSSPPPPVQYQLVTIGTFGGSESWVNGMNDHGDVVGAYDTGDWQSAFVWYNTGGAGTGYDVNDLLDAPEDWNVYDVTGINNNGQICGTAVRLSDSATVSVRLEPPFPLAVTVVNARVSEAYSINDSGDVIGYDNDAAGGLGGSFSYTNELGTEINPSRWSGMPFARCISNRTGSGGPTSAYVAGIDGNYAFKAVRYSPGGAVIALGELTSGGGSSIAIFKGVNSSGQCTGWARSSPRGWINHAWRYTNGQGMKDLGPSNSVGSGATAINDLGDVVGGVGGDKPYPFLYIDGYGMLDVRKLSADIPDTAIGIEPSDINNARDIAANINGVAVFLRETTP